MKKVKLFYGVFINVLANYPTWNIMEANVNAFLEEDGKSIKVLDVKHQMADNFVTVLVYYETLK